MSDTQDVQYNSPAGHYSNRNKVPTIDKFLASLDRDKKDRDAQIDSSAHPKLGGSDAQEHKVQKPMKGEKTVTDPVTGAQVEVLQ